MNAVLTESAPADVVLASYFKRNRQLGSRDRRLIREIVFAVFRWWGWGGEMLGDTGHLEPPRMLKRERRKEKTDIGAQLDLTEIPRLALFSLGLEGAEISGVAELWADACGVAPEDIRQDAATKELAARGAALRRRLASSSPPAESETPDLRKLLPDWISDQIEFPIPQEAAIGWFQTRPPVWIRTQNDFAAADIAPEFESAGISLEFHPAVERAANAGHPTRSLYGLDAFRKGAFEIQDIASQCIGLVCKPQPGERWWDACAGAGGKSLELSSLMQGDGEVVASDIRASKLKVLKQRARRSRMDNISCRQWNAKKGGQQQANFDGVLVDAPCSCSGTWRRNPDARWRIAPEDVEQLTAIQARMVRNAAAAVRSGGVLVYATCSMLPRENTQIVEQFLDENPGFQLEPFINPLSSTQCPGILQIWPWDADCDAVFIARLRHR